MLFIDACWLGYLVNLAEHGLTEDEVARIDDTCYVWCRPKSASAKGLPTRMFCDSVDPCCWITLETQGVCSRSRRYGMWELSELR